MIIPSYQLKCLYPQEKNINIHAFSFWAVRLNLRLCYLLKFRQYSSNRSEGSGHVSTIMLQQLLTYFSKIQCQPESFVMILKYLKSTTHKITLIVLQKNKPVTLGFTYYTIACLSCNKQLFSHAIRIVKPLFELFAYTILVLVQGCGVYVSVLCLQCGLVLTPSSIMMPKNFPI